MHDIDDTDDADGSGGRTDAHRVGPVTEDEQRRGSTPTPPWTPMETAVAVAADRSGGRSGGRQLLVRSGGGEGSKRQRQSWMTLDRRGGRCDCRRVLVAAMVEEEEEQEQEEQEPPRAPH